MTPILTLWVSESTNMLMAKLAALQINAASLMHCDSINTAAMTVENLKDTLQEKYRNLIDLAASDTTLHTLAILPLFEEKFAERLNLLTEAIKGASNRISLHIVALRGNIARIFEIGSDKISEQKERENINLLDTEAFGKYSFSIIDDYIESGASLKFTLNSLAEYLACFIIALCSDYYQILHPTLLADDKNKNIAIGLSSVRFDRKEVVNRLVHKVFVSALENAGIDQDNVDTQKCLSKATSILRGIDKRYEQFYAAYVAPLYTKGQISEGEIAAEIGQKIDEEFREIEHSLLGFLSDTSLSLPEREAILALILGRDNPRMQGIQYNQETLLTDDICNTPIDTFVSIFNQIPENDPNHSLLPRRGDYERLKLYYPPDSEGNVKESKENELAFNPISQIKQLKREIIDITAFIRRKTAELEQLSALEQERIDVENNDRRYKPQRINPKQTEIKEQPLDEKYEPPVGVNPMQSVDLRPFFSDIRDQGQVGSCSTFAVVSMYESFVNRLQQRAPGNKADLSEQFVFYYSNVLTGKAEGGSNFYDQLKVLGTNGLCDESLFSYSTDNIGVEPSTAAVEQAQQHRVLKAMQIELKDSGDKLDCIRTNHHLLTSALSQGYPVGVSLKLYDSFGKSGAYINRPNPEELASDIVEHHAMVLVGYSEENKCYIVRNSWGTDFGEKGYCYISASYIDDAELNSFCCIITETTEQAVDNPEETPALVAPFAGTQRQIEIATIRNILDEAFIILNSNQQLYDAYYQYYCRLQQQLEMPRTRHLLTTSAEKNCAAAVEVIAGKISDKQRALPSIIENYSKGIILNAIISSVIALILLCVSIYFTSIGEFSIFSTLNIITAVSILVAFFIFSNYKMNVRKKRRELTAEIEELAVKENRCRHDLLEKRLKLHISGLWLDNYHKLNTSLEKTYNRLVSYIGHLQTWMDEDRIATANTHIREGNMFISLCNTGLIESYFQQHIPQLVHQIDLTDTFNNYNIEKETILHARQRLYKDVGEAILSLFSNFRIYDYLSAKKSYSYIENLHLSDLISQLVNTGKPSCRHTSVSDDTPIYKILIEATDKEIPTLRSAVERHFPSAISFIQTSDSDSLILLTIRPIPVSSVK
ncbi:MAG: C1 family peptidase [Muribaculaceae bacterium]